MPETYKITGLMSGSSLDGVDLSFCEFSRDSGVWDSRIIHAETIPYPTPLRRELEKPEEWVAERILEMDKRLGVYYAGLINRFHEKNRLSPKLIASHGHTLLHEPDKGITFQAGHGGTIADLTRVLTINDFRREDVEQGGQGAPLVPIGDRLLFGKYKACLNLGGFANISYEDPYNKRVAYDTGPANLALNHIASLEGLDFDKDGKMAARGSVNHDLLDQLNSLKYYKRNPPKSLGKEWFRRVFLPRIENSAGTPQDLMATVVEHIAIQIASALTLAKADDVLVTGGGAMNLTLMKSLSHHSRSVIHIPDSHLVQYKEALVFAFLGLLRYLGEVNCLSSVTGGARDLSVGTIH